jgi:hypothetical protein
MAYSRPARSLADHREQPALRALVGRSVTRGVTGKLFTRRDTRPRLRLGQGAGGGQGLG